MPRRIVVSGYYGFGNTGDEAVLAGMLESFRQVGIDARVTVLSANPERTAAEHPGVEVAHRWRLLSVVRAIGSADLVISGGGSLVQDVTSAVSPYYYLGVLRLAQMLGRRTMVYAQGVGPLVRGRARRAAARAFSRTDLITVRDPDSKALIESIGVKRPEAHLSADPAFVVEPDLDAADALIAENGLSGQEFIGVCLRPWPGPDGWIEELCDGIGRAAAQIGVKVAVIPMKEPDDLLCGGVEGAIALKGSGRPRVIKGLISRCGLVIGMRLHSLIFAAGEATPMLPVVYDPKVESFAGIAGAEAGLGLGSLTATVVKDALATAWEKRRDSREQLAGKSREWTDLALVSARLAKQLLEA